MACMRVAAEAQRDALVHILYLCCRCMHVFAFAGVRRSTTLPAGWMMHDLHAFAFGAQCYAPIHDRMRN
jgi:hypothetical protein